MIDPNNKLDRLFMFIPGFLTWLMILMPIWLGIMFPRAATFILTFIAIYWLYMAVTHARGLILGYKTYKKALTIDWHKKCLDLDYDSLPNKETLPSKFDDLKHIILIPTYMESFEVLDPTFDVLTKSKFKIENIVLVIGTEEDGADKIEKNLRKLKEKHGNKLPRIMRYIHPKGLPDEIVGVASANRTWAMRHAVEQLKKEGVNTNDYLFSTFDSDTVLHEQYLSCLTYNYLIDEKRFNRFYESAVHLFANNLWEVPLVSRIEANNITFGLLASWTTESRLSETFSCYSCALDTVIAADYWDVKFIDDTVFFWRAFEARGGDFTAKYFHLPISLDATGGSDYVTAHKNLARQLVRWGWGSVSSVLVLKMVFTKKLEHATWENKLFWLYLKIERHLLARTSVFLITFGFAIITFVNVQFNSHAAVYGLPRIISIFLSAGILMFIPLTYIRTKIYPVPDSFPKWRKFTAIFEAPLVMLNMLTFSFLPWLYAETMMMFGKLPKVTFYTPKSR